MYKDKTIKIMKEIYCENNEKIDFINKLPLTDLGWETLSKCTIILFTYEAKVLHVMQNCLNIMNQLGYQSLYLKYLPRMDEQDLITLYQYHNPIVGIHKNQITANHKMIPSMGWPMVRKRFAKPILACMIMGQSNDFAQAVLSKKGSSNPINCNKNQIRSMAPTLVHTIMHSSDDMYAVLCESMLIFGQELTISLLNNPQIVVNEKSKKYKDLMLTYAEFDEYSAYKLKDILDYAKRKVEWMINLMLLNNEKDDRLDQLLLFLEGDRNAIEFKTLVDLLECYKFIFDISKQEIVESIIY